MVAAAQFIVSRALG